MEYLYYLQKIIQMKKKIKDKKIVKPSKAMVKDTTTGMGANIFIIPKKKPKKKKNNAKK